MSRWDGLSPRERAELMALFAREGVTDVGRMRSIYDEGGDIKPAVVKADYPRMREVIDLVNSSDANFVSRLRDKNRRTIPDWENKGYVATHKLGWTTKDGKAYVIPLVQEIDGELYDFTDPKYGFEDAFGAALDHALSTGDYVALPKDSDARWFTESYKNHYPEFNKYSGGGDKSGNSEVMVRLGDDDYLHQGELNPAVVIAESKKPMTYIPGEMFNIAGGKPASEEEIALRKVVDSLVRKEKPTPLTILDNYRSAYRNPFIVNPFAYNTPMVNKFDSGGDKDDDLSYIYGNDVYNGYIEPSVVSSKMSKKQFRKATKPIKRIINELNGSHWSDTQKRRMTEYIIRNSGGLIFPTPEIAKNIRMGLRDIDPNGLSGYERIMYGDEPVKYIIGDIADRSTVYDDYSGEAYINKPLKDYDGILHGDHFYNDYDIIDAYSSGKTPWKGVEVSGDFKYGPYGSYISRVYPDRNIKSYIYGDTDIPNEVIDRLNRYSSEKGDNSIMIGASSDNDVPFILDYGNDHINFDSAGHIWQFVKDDDGTIYRRQSDIYDFNPEQYNKSYGWIPRMNDVLGSLDKNGDPVVMFNQWEPATTIDLDRLSYGDKIHKTVDMDSIRELKKYELKPMEKFIRQMLTGVSTAVISARR